MRLHGCIAQSAACNLMSGGLGPALPGLSVKALGNSRREKSPERAKQVGCYLFRREAMHDRSAGFNQDINFR